MPNLSTKRWTDLDVMKGIAIALVVLGHIVARELPAGNAWYGELKYWIYKFHMPLFMYLAGLTFFLFQKPVLSLPDYSRFLAQRAARLLPPLFLVGIIVVLGKAILSGWVQIDNVVHDVWGDLLKLVYDPLRSPLSSIWFVYTLFILYAAATPLLVVTRWNAYYLLIIGALLHFLPLTDLFCLSKVSEYWFMFALGCVAAIHYRKLSEVSVRYNLLFWAFFLLLGAAAFLEWNEAWKKVALGLASVPVAHAIAQKVHGGFERALMLLGLYSFVIYLLNTLFIGATKTLLLTIHPWDGVAFLLYAPALFAAGLLGPVLLKLKIFSRNRFLDQITG